MTAKIIFNQEDTNAIINLYNIEGKTMQEIANIFNCHQTVISRTLKDNNVTKKFSKINRRARIDYFNKINTEDKAYILGFTIADGNIFIIPKKEYKISWTQTVEDKDVLDKIQKILLIDGKMYFRQNTNTYSLYLTSKPMVEDLLKLDIMPNKTYTKTRFFTKHLPVELYKHCVRGFVDGDGGFSKKNNKLGYNFSLTAYNKSILEDVANYINPIINAHNTIYTQYGSSWRAEWNWQEDVYKIAKFLYADSCIYLDRKYNIAQKIISTVEDIV